MKRPNRETLRRAAAIAGTDVPALRDLARDLLGRVVRGDRRAARVLVDHSEVFCAVLVADDDVEARR